MKALSIFIFFIGITISQTNLIAQETILRYPSLSPDGKQIAFSYQGDIWTTSSVGGVARRMTIHESYESHPQWSPDGKQIVFRGNRFGNSDLFVVNQNGDRPRQLTYFSGTDFSPKWTSDGNILFSSRRTFAQTERESEVMEVTAQGGTPYRKLDALGLSPNPSPDGRYIAFVRGTCRTVREAYKGPANRNIWLYDSKNNTYTQLTTFDGQDIYPDWGTSEMLYFLSARNGRYNLYSLRIKEGKAEGKPIALTNYKQEGIRYYDVNMQGTMAVIEHGSNFYTLDLKSKNKPSLIKIDVTKDYRFDPKENKQFTSGAEDYDVSPNGKYIAIVIRGEIFITPSDKDKKRAVQLTKHPYRDQEVQWLNDSTLLFLSDRSGNNELYMVRSSDPAERDLFKTFKLETKQLTQTADDENDINISLDKKKLAYKIGRGKLIVADISAEGTLSNQKVLSDSWSIPSGLSWSPDNKWLAYSMNDLDFNSEIYIQAADNSHPAVNVSLHPRGDFSPKWSKDGSKLGFLSNRNNGDTDVWFVWLKKADWEKTRRDWEDAEKPTDKKSKDKKDKNKVEPIQIDFENIYERLAQVTSLPGNESNLIISPDGETFYYSTNRGGRQGGGGKPAFNSIKWDGSEAKILVQNKSIRLLKWDKSGKAIQFLDNLGKLGKITVANKKIVNTAFTAKMKLNYPEERKQIFQDAWRALNTGFYDPEFHGQNFEALRKKYESRAVAASTSQDFRDLFNEMLGQLNASHMGMSGRNPEQTQREQTGLLGIEVVPDAKGVKITGVLTNSPADRENSKLVVGEIITAVNGTLLTPTMNFYQLLNGTGNERTLLNILGTDGTTREVVIRPATSLRNELYEAWVKDRKALTEKYSGGRLGYIHIRGMNWSSFERFERELMASGLGKDGIVIDVRFNGGGWTTDMLMTVLNVRQHSYTIPRGAVASLNKEHTKFRKYYPFGERLPLSALTKPSIALCNENSYSNAEIFSHAYKQLGLGTLVGKPTFGAVISTGSHRLIDGSRVRMPFRAWYVKATGENMEHGPAVPDLIVDNQPDSKAKGEDLQLKAAVEMLLKQIKGEEEVTTGEDK